MFKKLLDLLPLSPPTLSIFTHSLPLCTTQYPLQTPVSLFVKLPYPFEFLFFYFLTNPNKHILPIYTTQYPLQAPIALFVIFTLTLLHMSIQFLNILFNAILDFAHTSHRVPLLFHTAFLYIPPNTLYKHLSPCS